MIALLLTTLFTLVELNCENLFDTRHDSLKADTEYLPQSDHRWTSSRYWRKVNAVARAVVACGEDEGQWRLPDVVALCEVENDSVMHDLTRRSLLRRAGYDYLITSSADRRGVDVALMYNPATFRPLVTHPLRVDTTLLERPTRDMLYVSGLVASGDTMHIYVVHAPSRMGGELTTRPYRLAVAQRLLASVDSLRALSPRALIVVAGDFNDYTSSPALQRLARHGLTDVSSQAQGRHGAKGTYRYQGRWESLDHVVCSEKAARRLADCRVVDAPFLLEPDPQHGGSKPRRTYLGPRYHGGTSDHLPLVARFNLAF